MNCQEFEQTVAELAADKLTSARARVSALTHAAACEPCDARLAAEKTLNQGLLALAESTSGEQASARLRQSLRATFEAQGRQARNAVEAAAPNVIRMPVHKPVVRRQWTWALAAAAAAIVFAVAVSAWQSHRTPKSTTIMAGSSPAPDVMPVRPMPSPERIAPQNDVATRPANQKQIGEIVKNKRRPPSGRQQLVQSGENDLAASYFPLSYATGSAMPEESLVIRVDVPRTTLIAMGLLLPMHLNAERGNELVKADLRVGIDGVPLAIRLVRQ